MLTSSVTTLRWCWRSGYTRIQYNGGGSGGDPTVDKHQACNDIVEIRPITGRQQ